ncbi:MAG: hypothetical protein FWF87_05665 [Synergistaceae bacterium]|nr:hypothetical protein [Synergistaceae bacterium]
MKRIISLFLCVSLLLSVQPGGVFAAGGGAPGVYVYTDEMIVQMTEQYRNMDIDAMVKMMSKSGQVMDEKTIEAMRDMQKMAREGTLGDYLRSFGTADEAAFTAAKIDVTAPTAGDVLAIAKKYYGYHSTALNGSLKGEFARDAGSVAFDGKANDARRAESLCNTASAIAMLNGDGDYAVAAAAAAVGWAPGYARGAGTLAAMLVKAGFITDKDRLNDAVKLAAYAISIDKADADFHITLGWALFDLNDLDGALEAAEAALAIEPGNSAALNLKIEILNKKGGTFLSAAAGKIGDDLKENDGELSKRLTKQEKAAEGMRMANKDDSKEEALRKFNQFCELEPVTPADMIESVFPTEARQIRKQVSTVSDSDKAMFNNSIRPFPNGLYRTARQVHEMEDEISEYWKWEHDDQEKRGHNVITPAFRAAEAAKRKRGTEYHRPQTPLDYMLEYNRGVLLNARIAAGEYLGKLDYEYSNELHEIYEKDSRKYKEALATRDAEKEAAERLPEPAKSAAHEAAEIKYKLAINDAEDIAFKERMPIKSKYYDESKRVSRQLWEKMLPFARATRHPEYEVINLYHDACRHIEFAISLASTRPALYYPEVSAEDLQEALATARAAIEQLMAQEQSPFEDVTNGFTISVEFGNFEFKLSNNKIEVEYVDGAACKVAFDWKSKELEVGMGVGHKAKLGTVKGAQVGVEAKAYVNFVLNLRNNEVTDIYISAEAKGSAGSFEAGGQARVSLLGKEAGISSAAKRKLGSFAIEHEMALIKTSLVILEFNHRYGSRRAWGARFICYNLDENFKIGMA